jgi:AcrR family transcriptional regulator
VTEPQRRRGPRVDVDVPTALVDAAEVLFGSEGVDNVSMRSVAREAGVAPAALTHHFSSKHHLVEAVVMRRGRELGDDVRRRLHDLQAADVVTTRDLVDSVLVPFVEEINREPESGVRWVRTVITLALNGDDVINLAIADQGQGFGDIATLFITAASKVEDLDESAVELRAPIAMFSMLTALATADLGGYGRPIGPTGLDPEYVEQLARFTSSGLRAG